MSKLSRQTRQINKGSKKLAAAGGDLSKANLSAKQLNARLDNSLLSKKYDNYHKASDPIIKEQYKAGLNLKNAKQAVRGGMRPDTVSSFGLGGDVKGDYGKLLNSRAYQKMKANDAGYKNVRQQRKAEEAANKPTNSKKSTPNNTVPRESSKQSAEGDAWLKEQNKKWANSSNNPANKPAAGAKPAAAVKPAATAVKPSVKKDPNAGKIRLTQDSDGDWVDKDGNLPTMQMRGKTFKDGSGNQITNTVNPTTGQNRSIIIPANNTGINSGQARPDIGTNITRGTALAASGAGSKDPLDNSANNNIAKTVDNTNTGNKTSNNGGANGGAGKGSSAGGSYFVSSEKPYGSKKESTDNVATNTNDPKGGGNPGLNTTNTKVEKSSQLDPSSTKTTPNDDLAKKPKDKSKKKKPTGSGVGDLAKNILKPGEISAGKDNTKIKETSSSGAKFTNLATVKMNVIT